VTEETTSSSAMMMSAPMRFWIWMECSGVSSIRSPSTGDWKLTPSSVMSAKCNKDTCRVVVAARHKSRAVAVWAVLALMWVLWSWGGALATAVFVALCAVGLVCGVCYQSIRREDSGHSPETNRNVAALGSSA
jgi:hypothetical protein